MEDFADSIDAFEALMDAKKAYTIYNRMNFEALRSICDGTPFRVFLATTGGGVGLQKMLWETLGQKQGPSTYLVGSSVPYEPEMTDSFLGFKPEKYASAETAVDLAMQAYYMAYKPGGAPAVGVGLSASVASTREHRGAHRVFAAYFSDTGCRLVSVEIKKGVGLISRIKDGALCDFVGLTMLLKGTNVLGVLDDLAMPDFLKEMILSYRDEPADDLAREQFFKRSYFSASGYRYPVLCSGMQTIYPGAFNPAHDGHFGCEAAYLKANPGKSVVFAICADPPNKPALTTAEMLQRAKGLKGRNRMITSGDAFYIEKARRNPMCHMILGADAALRLLDPKWGIDVTATLEEFESLRTVIHVFGRVIDGVFVSGDDVREKVPYPYRYFFKAIEGRWDVSSSEIRAKQ